MKKLLSILLAITFFLSCKSSDEDVVEFPSISGLSYAIAKVELEIPVDINGDGTFSRDLVPEAMGCFSQSFIFGLNGKVPNPAVNDIISLNINYTSSGIPSSQSAACPILDFPSANYTQAGNSVNLFYSNFPAFVTGTISDDLNTVTFTFTFQNFVAQSFNGGGVIGNKILNQDGTVTEYDGTITLTYMRQ